MRREKSVLGHTAFFGI